MTLLDRPLVRNWILETVGRYANNTGRAGSDSGSV